MNAGEWQIRRDICDVGRRMHQAGLVAGTDGNISARLGLERILITPSGSCLGRLEPDQIASINLRGDPLPGSTAPSSERWMHLCAYERRPEIHAAIHAHPPTAIALTLAGMTIDPCALPEIIIAFGRVPTTAYATPATRDGALVVAEWVDRFDALILDRHGSFTIGKSLFDALYKLEKLEHGAHVLYMAHQMGGVRGLPPDEVAKLASLREQFGFARSDVVTQCREPDTIVPRVTRGPDNY
ncbi:MAG: class II aldolase/adducin family protein [Phycisphaerae bacterium]|nr:class II aldolase/adducin family protein [Phycisphaerae bacterium]